MQGAQRNKWAAQQRRPTVLDDVEAGSWPHFVSIFFWVSLPMNRGERIAGLIHRETAIGVSGLKTGTQQKKLNPLCFHAVYSGT
jgi:hypothetical protein